jgi:hypothetical protein
MGVQRESTSVIRRLKETYDSVGRELLYNILTEFRVPMNLVRPIKSFKIKHSNVRISKYLSNAFSIQNVLN